MKKLFALLLALSLTVVPGAAVFVPSGYPAASPAAFAPDEHPASSAATVILTLSDDSDESRNIPAASKSDTDFSLMLGSPSINITYRDDSFIILDHSGSEEEITDFITNIRKCPEVLCAEFDRKVTLAQASPLLSRDLNDTYISAQYWLNNIGSYSRFSSSGVYIDTESTVDIDIDAFEGWDFYDPLVAYSSSVVAVIDTGIDYTHPDLVGSMWINKDEIPGNGIDDDGNGFIDDVYGWDFYNEDSTVCHYSFSEAHNAFLASEADNDNHGTHCAGIIAAAANNSTGIAGVASVGNVKLMSLKVYGGADREGNMSNVIKAIHYAEAMGADICNISWGYYDYSTALYTAIRRSSMLFVCAAGNDGIDNDELPLYPASYDLDNIISVAYLDANGKLTSTSNYGAASVDVAVPGTNIFSTVVGSYKSMSGSSMAAPQVTGMAALLYTYGKGIYPASVRNVIMNGTKVIESCYGKTVTGGIPSLLYILTGTELLGFDEFAPSIKYSVGFDKSDILLTVSANDNGPSGTSNVRYFTGKRSTGYFKHGTAGTAVSDNIIRLSKAGTYTVFARDNAKNESIRTIKVPDDVVKPDISDFAVSVNNKMTKITVSFNVSDSQSGIRSVKYLKGTRSEKDFKSKDAIELTPDENGDVSFTVTEQGRYSILVTDYRGNSNLSKVYATIRKATSVALNKSKKTLTEGTKYKLTATLTPSNSTDRLTFASSDEEVARVSSKGVVTAVAPGQCKIKVTTSSGKTATCKIKVSPAGEE